MQLFSIVTAGLTLVCCTPHPTPNDPSRHRLVADDALGVMFEVPKTWVERLEGAARVFSGPEGTPAFFATLTLQAVGRAGDSDDLPDMLSAAYLPASSLPEFSWERREYAIFSAQPAIFYRVRFELHETMRRKTGVLLDTGRIVVDLSHGSDAALYPHSLEAFHHAAHSMVVLTP